MPKRNANSVRPVVISFRITGKQQKIVDAILSRESVGNVKSRNQYARKILSDFLAGRLVFTNPTDRLMDVDMLG